MQPICNYGLSHMITADLPLIAQPAVPPMHRRNDPDTSRDAAQKVKRTLSVMHRRVLDAVRAAGERGVTGGELEKAPAFADCGSSSVRKRLSELHQLGRLRDIGRRDGMTVYVLDGAA